MRKICNGYRQFIKLGNAFEKAVRDPTSVCEEVKNALREEIANRLISSQDVERYCPNKWKRTTRPNRLKQIDKLSISDCNKDNRQIVIDIFGKPANVLPPKDEAARETTTAAEDIEISNNNNNNANSSPAASQQILHNHQEIQNLKTQKLNKDYTNIQQIQEAGSEHTKATQAAAEEAIINLQQLLYLNSSLERHIHIKFQELNTLDHLCRQRKLQLGLF